MDKWDARFLRIASEVSSWSKDPGTRVGAVLVCARRIIATGYNGFPANISDKTDRYLNRETKLKLTVHAEVNAIINAAKSGASTQGSTLYVTFSPCIHCAIAVIQSGVCRIVCPTIESAPERWRDNFVEGAQVLREAGISITYFDPDVFRKECALYYERRVP